MQPGFDTFQYLLSAGDPAEIGKGKKKPLPDSHRTAEKLEGWLEKYARNAYAEGTKEIRPICVAVCANGDIVHLLNGSNFHERDKQRWVKTLRTAFKGWNVKHYGLISEIWMAAYEGDQIDETGKIRKDAPQPSAHKQRHEAVGIMTADRRGRKRIRTLLIERDHATGAVTKLHEMGGEGRNYAGRMLDLLEDYSEHDGFNTHPCEIAEWVKGHEMSLMWLGSIALSEEKFGDQYEAFKARSEALAERLSAAFEALKATPIEKLEQDDAPLKAYEAVRDEMQPLMSSMKPYFSQALQDLITQKEAEMAAQKAAAGGP
jgi:hypothetical protein